MLLKRKILGLLPLTLLFAGTAFAQTPTVSELSAQMDATNAQNSYIFNTLLFLIGGFLVMWCHARSRLGAFKKRVHAVFKEHFALRCCRHHVLGGRLSTHVRYNRRRFYRKTGIHVI